MMVVFTVPGAPVGKGRGRIVRKGKHMGIASAEKTVSYEGLVAHTAQAAMAGRPLILGPCAVTLRMWLPIAASWSKTKQAEALAGKLLPAVKPDMDNVIKAIYDGMNGVVWRDDVQAVDLAVTKRYGAIPGVLVAVEEIQC